MTENFAQRIKHFVQSTDSRLLVFTPIIFGLVIIGIMAPWFDESQGKSQPNNIFRIAFTTASLLMALSGLMQVVKKEVPIRLSSPASIEGKLAVFIGIFWILFWGSLGIGLAFF